MAPNDADARVAPSATYGGAVGGATYQSQLLTAEQLGRRWQVSRAHVYRLSREGRIPTVQIGRYFRYRLDAIEEWERAQ